MAKPDPEDAIRSPEPEVRVGAQRDLKLMPEDQVLEGEITASANRSDESAESEPNQFKHPSGWQQPAWRKLGWIDFCRPSTVPSFALRQDHAFAINEQKWP